MKMADQERDSEATVMKMGGQFLVESSTDGKPHDLRLFSRQALATYLRQNMEDQHYAWGGDEIHGIYRYDSPGRLTELQLTCIRPDQTDGDDYMHSVWQVWEPGDNGGCKVELEFSLTLDGRV
jgi:hypothetical protein